MFSTNIIGLAEGLKSCSQVQVRLHGSPMKSGHQIARAYTAPSTLSSHTAFSSFLLTFSSIYSLLSGVAGL
jgi:hypothetical protein